MKKIYLLILFVGFLSFDAFAQDEQETTSNESGVSGDSPFASSKARFCWTCWKKHSGGCTPTPPPPQQDVPIDGGLSILLAAGAAYGVKRKLKKRKM